MIIKLTLLSILFIRSRKILLRKNKNQTKKPTSKIHTTSDFLNLIYHNTTMTCCPCTYYHALSSIISFIYIYHQVKRKTVNSIIDKIKHNCLLWKQKIKKKNDTSLIFQSWKEKKIAQKITLIQTESFLEIEYLLMTSLDLCYYLHTSFTVPLLNYQSVYYWLTNLLMFLVACWHK